MSKTEQYAIINLTIGKVGNLREATKQMREVPRVVMNDIIVCPALYKARLTFACKRKRTASLKAKC